MNQEIINKLLEYIKRSEDFLIEEIPDVLQQALAYERFSIIISFCFCLIAFAVLFSLAIYSYKNPIYDDPGKYSTRTVESFMLLLVSSILSVPSFVGIFSSIDSYIKLSIAPKYFLIQLIMKLNK